MTVFVIDTNVVVSGLLTGNPFAPTAQIVDAMLRGAFPLLLSIDLIAEYRSVLLRPAIVARHGLTETEIDRVLTEIVASAMVREPAETVESPTDHGDRHLWHLLASHPGAVLVTGDQPLLRHPPGFASVIDPVSFVSARGWAG